MEYKVHRKEGGSSGGKHRYLFCERNEGGQRKMGDCSWYNAVLIITYVETARLKPKLTPWLCATCKSRLFWSLVFSYEGKNSVLDTR